jgi:prepilin peptidase CpaA
MHRIEPAAAAIAVALTLVLVWAAVSDVRVRKIPNRAVLAVLGLFVVWSAFAHGAGLVSGLEAGAISFAVGYGLYAFGIMGAGDAKLFAAVSLFTGLPLLPLFAVATALAGGVVALASVASRPQRAMAMLTMRGKGEFGRGVPYGVAISIGGAIAVWTGLAEGLLAG